ncbi:MAG TPA: PhzF family phenazine biosynthesis protein [Selenomonadales bacterium]|nr:PhzF family phenazine biosynthesis protein [Selenomonadales bacterium]
MKYYVVDAFAEKVFEGNPAGVCVLENWFSDELMEKIAMENNLSETAFTVKENSIYRLRWFTPGGEIDLCGHATLATAFVLANFYEPASTEFIFETLSGNLSVARKGDLYEMDFPAYHLSPVPVTDKMAEAIGVRPVEAWMARDLVCVLGEENQVLAAQPDQAKLKALDGLLLQLTAKGTEYDCITRTFAPKLGVEEDPVCGSGHCHVIPLWAKKLEKNTLVARQASRRGGTLYCQDCGERIKISGKAVLYATAELHVGR